VRLNSGANAVEMAQQCLAHSANTFSLTGVAALL
jgi:hypothetical protein